MNRSFFNVILGGFGGTDQTSSKTSKEQKPVKRGIADDEAFLRRIIFNVEFPIPDIEMRTQLWQFHISEKVPKNISYERAAEISEGLCGGDIRNITIKLGLKLLVGKVKAIDEEIINEEIDKYKTIKLRHKKINFPETVVLENANNSNLKEE